jgi:cysteine desulfurase
MTVDHPPRAAAIYLDGFATMPIAPEALDALNAQLGRVGNPHSPHLAGAQAHAAVDKARISVAHLLGANPEEITFTSGATEANNLAILGWARAAAKAGDPRRQIVTSSIEHPSVLEAAAALTSEGFSHRLVPVGADGRVALSDLEAMLSDETLLVAVMAASNITGVLQPITDVAELARAAGALLHVDAAQAAGKIAFDVHGWEADSVSLSGHKLYGPPGVGALFVSTAAPVKPDPLVHGGGQEAGLRPGTVPAALVAGFGAAAEVARRDMVGHAGHLRQLEAAFLEALGERQIRFVINGDGDQRIPGALNIALVGIDADDIVERLSAEVLLSTGSACSSGQIDVAPTLRFMGIDERRARSSLRVCFNRYLTLNDALSASHQISAACRSAALATGEAVQ